MAKETTITSSIQRYWETKRRRNICSFWVNCWPTPSSTVIWSASTFLLFSSSCSSRRMWHSKTCSLFFPKRTPRNINICWIPTAMWRTWKFTSVWSQTGKKALKSKWSKMEKMCKWPKITSNFTLSCFLNSWSLTCIKKQWKVSSEVSTPSSKWSTSKSGSAVTSSGASLRESKKSLLKLCSRMWSFQAETKLTRLGSKTIFQKLTVKFWKVS